MRGNPQALAAIVGAAFGLIASCAPNLPPEPPPTCTDCSGPCQICWHTTCFAADAGTEPQGCGAYVCGADAGCLTECNGPADCQRDAFCDGGVCQAFRPLGTPCLGGGECASTFCSDAVCCDSACDGDCDTCDSTGTCAPSAIGSAGSPSCAPYVCTGGTSCPTGCADDTACAAGSYCDGASCVPGEAAGATCARARQCAGGFCADGVCCDTACNGACDACDVTGSVGTCTNVPAGSAGNPTCDPYVCTGTSAACGTSCTGDGGCALGAACIAGTCQAALMNGQPCGDPSECRSGFCADGVCCNTACANACDACDLSGSAGTCGIADAGRPGRPSCSPFVCTGTSTACPTGCTSNASCAQGYACSGTSCLVDGDLDGVADVDDCAPADNTKWTARSCYADNDLDLVFAEAATMVCSGAACPSGTQTTAGTDCDDDAGTKYQRLPCYGAADNDSDNYYAGTAVQTCTGAVCPSGSSSFQDCDDNNASAKPGQFTYFNTARADGSFDYDCDGQQTKEPAWDCVTDAGAGSICSTTPFPYGRGFVGATPACGATGTYWANGVFATCADLSYLYNACTGPVSDGGAYTWIGTSRQVRCK